MSAEAERQLKALNREAHEAIQDLEGILKRVKEVEGVIAETLEPIMVEQIGRMLFGETDNVLAVFLRGIISQVVDERMVQLHKEFFEALDRAGAKRDKEDATYRASVAFAEYSQRNLVSPLAMALKQRGKKKQQPKGAHKSGK